MLAEHPNLNLIKYNKYIKNQPPGPGNRAPGRFLSYFYGLLIFPPGGSKWIISVGDYVLHNSFTALRSSDLREVRLEL